MPPKIFGFFKITIKKYWKSLENFTSNWASLKKNFWVLKKSSNCDLSMKKMNFSAGGHKKIEYGDENFIFYKNDIDLKNSFTGLEYI